MLHAHGADFDNPALLACRVIGDGEGETGALGASWHSDKFLNPARDGAVLPILHDEPASMDRAMSAALDNGFVHRRPWLVIVLRPEIGFESLEGIGSRARPPAP